MMIIKIFTPTSILSSLLIGLPSFPCHPFRLFAAHLLLIPLNYDHVTETKNQSLNRAHKALYKLLPTTLNVSPVPFPFLTLLLTVS